MSEETQSAPRRFTRRHVAHAGIGALGALTLGAGVAQTIRRPGGAGVAAAPDGGSHASHHGGSPLRTQAAAPAGPNPWVEPRQVMSVDGLLEVTLDAAPLEGAGVGRMAYSGSIPGPTLRFRPGDTVRVLLQNNIGKMTNLHTHGLHVSPEGNSDNIFQMVDAEQSFQYEYQIPQNHPAGSLWYHPHHHGDAHAQVDDGLAGAIIVESDFDQLPGISELVERHFVLQGEAPDTTVNGVANPEVAMRPGQSQRWRLFNCSANATFNLQLDGHTLNLISLDGNSLPAVVPTDTVVLGAGERAEVIVQAGDAGTYTFASLAWGNGGQKQDTFTVATVTVAGAPMTAPPLPDKLIQFDDLAKADIAQQRIITFQEGANNLPFSINGQAFDPEVVNTTVKLGTTEEWLLRNSSSEFHPFHIHVEDFQVMSVNGVPFPYVNRQDSVLLPPRGQVVVRIPFLDFTGKFVYHCHILSHEDFGMMSVIEVVD